MKGIIIIISMAKRDIKYKFNNMIMALAIVLLTGMFMSACVDSRDLTDNIIIYKINEEGTNIEEVDSGMSTVPEDTWETITYLLNTYWLDASGDNASGELYERLSDVELIDIKVDNNALTLEFNSAYNNLGKYEELLYRASVVETLIQIRGINRISFKVAGEYLTNEDGSPVGFMNEDTFVLNPSSFFNSYQEVTLTLYYSSEDGQSLVREERTVHYLNSVSLQKLVVDQLIKGPLTDDAKSAISAETNVISVTLSNGICYVNFDSGFLTQDVTVSEEVVIYSIVDSLFALGDIDSVKISVNGESDMVYRDSISLDQEFHEDLSLVDLSAASSDAIYTEDSEEE